MSTCCVISAVGRNSLHREWVSGEHSFDLHLIVYDETSELFLTDTQFISKGKGFKFKLVYAYLKSNQEILQQYDYFFIPDDDISMDAYNIEKMFSYMERYQFSIAQPALTNSYYTYEITMKKARSILRYSNFVEVMTPCFSKAALNKVFFTFNENDNGWGIDFHWSKLIGFSGFEMAIIDDVIAVHTRPVQSINIPNINELNEYLLKYSLSRDINTFGCIPRETSADLKLIISDDEKSELILNGIELVANELLNHVSEVENVGLYNGRIGISLFFFEYYKLTGKRKCYDVAEIILNSIFGSLNQLTTSLSEGLSGVTWFIEYLAQNNFIENDTDEVLEEINEVLDKVDVNDMTNSSLKNGLLGYGMHYIARLSNPNCFRNKTHYQKESNKVGEIVDKLESRFNEFNLDFADIYEIIEVSSFLCQLSKIGSLNVKAEILLNKNALLILKYINEESSIWEQQSQTNTELLLRYLKIAATLFKIAIITKKIVYNEIAIKLALSTTLKKVDNDIDNIGPFWVSYLYGNLYRLTNLDEFKTAASDWTNRVSTSLKNNGEFGLTNGLAGKGLVMISALSDSKLVWDECLLF